MKWFTVQNGKQVDIHERVDGRELTVACNVMPQHADLIAVTPELLGALKTIARGYNDGGKLTREYFIDIAQQAISKAVD